MLLDQRFYDWREMFPFFGTVLQQLDVVREEWRSVVPAGPGGESDDGPGVIDSPELTYDRTSQSWKNYWMVHSFPAETSTFLTWIDVNCARMPRTANMLRQMPGLRDAFFSTMSCDMELDKHFGYADQSNHVLRCHIPLFLPDHNAAAADAMTATVPGAVVLASGPGTPLPVSGAPAAPSAVTSGGAAIEAPPVSMLAPPCYIEVEGERRYHQYGNVIVFDDSKLHCAGNMSPTQSRTVLIVDIVRPPHVRKGQSGSLISRTMMAMWCRQVHPDVSEERIKQMVDDRVPHLTCFEEDDNRGSESGWV